ncbi:MAG TPA: MOSC domain-containing protein [Pseudogracilibacillus sp.]|nr:MOSC domain-containing protein [Pseudogracilibacillus sp.]
MSEPIVVQIRTGKAKEMGEEGAKHPMDRPWKSAIYKQPITGERLLTELGLKQDEVGDPVAHGGAEKALFAYPSIHFPKWRQELDIAISEGGFGENLVVEKMDETSVCLGDVYQLGDAKIEVSQPRRPCWKPARRHRIMDFALRIQNSGRTGWYYRVVEEGNISAPAALTLLKRPFPEWTIAAANEVMYVRKKDVAAAKALADCPALAPNWKRSLYKRLEGRESNSRKRVYGPNKEAH